MLLTGETFAQSEPDIIPALAARHAKRGIGANGLTQKNPIEPIQSECFATRTLAFT